MATETKTSLNKICHARYNYTTSLTPDTPFDIDIEMNEFSHKLIRDESVQRIEVDSEIYLNNESGLPSEAAFD